MTTENMKTVEIFVAEMNTVVDAAKKSSKKMFSIFLEAAGTLPQEKFDQFTSDINLDRSSINKMTKIVKKSAIVDNLERLPFAWSTLYVLVKLTDDQILNLIETKAIDRKSKIEEVKEERKKLLGDKASNGDAQAQATSASDDVTPSSSTDNREYAESSGKSRSINLAVKHQPSREDKERVNRALNDLDEFIDVTELRDYLIGEQREAA